MTSTIKLSYDHQIFASQVYGGISRYFYEIAKRVSIYTDFDVKMVAPFYVNEYLFRDKDLSIYGQHIKKLPYSTLATRKFNYPFAKKYLSAHTPDIVHETYFSSNSAAPKRSRLAITVFDMIHEKYSRYFPILDRTVKHKQAAILRADHIFCISNSTKNDLIELTGVDQNKVTVTH